MQIKKKHFIIGLLCTLGFFIQISDAMALYSPRLSRGVSKIRQHMDSSQAQNGNESILSKIDSIKAYNRADREAKDETGVPGNVSVAQEMILNNINIYQPFETLAMVFNFNYVNAEIISTCLRDDIWHLEMLRDKVGAEMVKAYWLFDTYHGNLLASDYAWLTQHINLLRSTGSNPKAKIWVKNKNFNWQITSHEFFFDDDDTNDDQLNYYSNVDSILGYGKTTCPEGEFEEAINEVVNSYKNLNNTVGRNSLFSREGWGDIWKMAGINAKKRAREWIRANQISLTIGGEEGGKIESLIKNDGLNRFVGDVKTQLQIMENMVGPVVPFFDESIYKAPAEDVKPGLGTECVYYYHESEVYRDCLENQLEEYEKCKENAEEAERLYKVDCDRFKNPTEILSATQLLAREEALVQSNIETKEDAKRAFVYSISLDSVSENNIIDMSDVLWDMNMQILRGPEKGGNDKDKDPGIPSITKYLEVLSNRQCVNKGG